MAEKPPLDPEFEALLRHIQESRGLDFRGYKRTSLQRRIKLRMEALGVETFSSYQAHLEVHPGEFADLLNTVLINVTSFFRDEEAWASLKTQVIPAIVADAVDDRPIRIWSVGCASGEEPYSIAMLMAEQLGLPDFSRRVKVYATDLDEEALKTARLATYSPREIEGVPPEYLERYFERTNNHYVVARDLRKYVIFGRHNVVHDAPISRIDLVICRNLLIYLEAETQEVVLPRLHYALAPSGFLFLGKAETQLARSSLFKTVDSKHRIFAKVPQEWRRPSGGAFPQGRQQRDTVPQAGLVEAALNECGTAVMVIDEAGLVTVANTPARQLLSLGEADIGRPFQDLPISYRPIELRGPIDEAFGKRRSVRLENQEYRPGSTEGVQLTIDIKPLLRPNGSAYAALLAFTDNTKLHALQRELESAQENLENSIEELQSANEELETTNEELQSTNEELETTNEELQSTNEELETLNEEARSTNEEMEAINEELRIQAEQASSYRLYLESVLRSMNGGIIVVDEAGTIQSWNRWSENTWGLRSDEVLGTSLGILDIGLPLHLVRDEMNAVLSGREDQIERTLPALDRRGRRLLCLVRIMRLFDEENAGRGLVLIVQDVTEERRKEDYIQYLGRIMGRALNEVYFLDPVTLRFQLANDGARKKLGYSDQQLTNLTLADLTPRVSEADLKLLIEPLLTGRKSDIVVETTIRSASGSEHPVEICLQYFGEEAPPLLLAVVHVTSERQQIGAM
jgi:two-component system CheB/CheR fusion protein